MARTTNLVDSTDSPAITGRANAIVATTVAMIRPSAVKWRRQPGRSGAT